MEDLAKQSKQEMLQRLSERFTDIRERRGADGMVDYVEGADVRERLIEATGGTFDWEILDLRFMERSQKVTSRGEVTDVNAYWMCWGRLTIPGLGSRDGVGTAPMEDAEAPKTATTDALKRAASEFGVALHLAHTTKNRKKTRPAAAAPVQASSNSQVRETVAAAIAEPGIATCTCNTKNRYHAPSCPKRAAA